jgi:hypothetical protein
VLSASGDQLAEAATADEPNAGAMSAALAGLAESESAAISAAPQAVFDFIIMPLP